MPDVAFAFGKVTLRSTTDAYLSFSGVEPPAIPVSENIVTFVLNDWHLEQGVPKDGPA